MAEYNSDEERFAAVINFLKDYKTIILSSLAIIFISLISIISFQSYKETRNSDAATIYDSWLTALESDNESAKQIFDEARQVLPRLTRLITDFEKAQERHAPPKPPSWPGQIALLALVLAIISFFTKLH